MSAPSRGAPRRPRARASTSAIWLILTIRPTSASSSARSSSRGVSPSYVEERSGRRCEWQVMLDPDVVSGQLNRAVDAHATGPGGLPLPNQHFHARRRPRLQCPERSGGQVAQHSALGACKQCRGLGTKGHRGVVAVGEHAWMFALKSARAISLAIAASRMPALSSWWRETRPCWWDAIAAIRWSRVPDTATASRTPRILTRLRM